MFHTLYELGSAAETVCCGEDIYACAAAREGEYALLLTYYTDDDGAPPSASVTSL